MSRSWKIFIDGEWRTTAELAEVRNPWDESVVGLVHQASRSELEEAAAAAQRAFQQGRRMGAHARSRMLSAIATGIEARAEELAISIQEGAGKPITFARGEVKRAAGTFRIASEESRRLGGEVMPLDWTADSPGRTGLTRRFPMGPVAGISPFNFPLNLVAHKVAPALAVGCPIVIKPPHQAPLTALLLGEIAEQAGVPKGMLQVVPCEGPTAQWLAESPAFKVLSFTGSPNVGWKLKQLAFDKKVTLELGGNAAVIVEPDADLDAAAPRIATGAFAYAGQVCISVQRVFAHESILEGLRRRLLDAVERQVIVGDPAQEATVVGPLIDSGAADRVESWIDRARAAGARVLCGGEREGCLITPAILEEVSPDLEVSCKEIFGPVLVLQGYGDLDEALAAANDSIYGLQAGVFTRDLPHIWRAFRELEVGAVVVNDVPMYRADQMPYGGVKQSGFGREGLRWSMETMSELRLLVLNMSGFPEAADE